MWGYRAYQFLRLQVQRSDPLMPATARNTFPLAKVDAIIPRVHDSKRIFTNLGFEVEQCQPVSLIILTKHRGEKKAKAAEKDKRVHGKR